MNDSTFGSGWLPVLVILLVLFGMGGGGFGIGNNAAYATMADVNSAINNQSVQQSLNSALLSSNNNNYETAQLINQQTKDMSIAELGHAMRLHDYAVQDIEQLKTVYPDIPVEMQDKWDRSHKEFVEKTAWIKQMQAM